MKRLLPVAAAALAALVAGAALSLAAGASSRLDYTFVALNVLPPG